MKVTLTEPGIAGEYVVGERGEDGSILLVPDTSAESIRERHGLRRMSDEELEEHFGDLPSDGEG